MDYLSPLRQNPEFNIQKDIMSTPCWLSPSRQILSIIMIKSQKTRPKGACSRGRPLTNPLNPEKPSRQEAVLFAVPPATSTLPPCSSARLRGPIDGHVNPYGRLNLDMITGSALV
jgi:hypothetical protein